MFFENRLMEHHENHYSMEPSKSQRREGNGAKRDEKGGVCQFFSQVSRQNNQNENVKSSALSENVINLLCN